MSLILAVIAAVLGGLLVGYSIARGREERDSLTNVVNATSEPQSEATEKVPFNADHAEEKWNWACLNCESHGWSTQPRTWDYAAELGQKHKHKSGGHVTVVVPGDELQEAVDRARKFRNSHQGSNGAGEEENGVDVDAETADVEVDEAEAESVAAQAFQDKVEEEEKKHPSRLDETHYCPARGCDFEHDWIPSFARHITTTHNGWSGDRDYLTFDEKQALEAGVGEAVVAVEDKSELLDASKILGRAKKIHPNIGPTQKKVVVAMAKAAEPNGFVKSKAIYEELAPMLNVPVDRSLRLRVSSAIRYLKDTNPPIVADEGYGKWRLTKAVLNGEDSPGPIVFYEDGAWEQPQACPEGCGFLTGDKEIMQEHFSEKHGGKVYV